MPGAVTMDEVSVIGSQDLKKDKSQAQETTMAGSDPPPVQAQPVALANGTADHGPNGVLPNGVTQAEQLANGEVDGSTITPANLMSPPPLDESWRDSTHNKSLGRMLERLAQKCYKDLDITLTRMSEIPSDPVQNQANGVIQHVGEDTSQASLEKKRLLLKFAKEQRDVFIKTLVLSDWCRNEDDQGKLISVKVWQDKQLIAQDNAIRAIKQTNQNMVQAKVPGPNIEGAMELLATGKASWVPDMGFIPPPRLSAKQLLKTLRNMNVILATRLNLHEDLPAHFSDFSIADGRATFTVQDEFEVDVTVADEDPATPFYFIDIRLLFTPTSNILTDQLRQPLERNVNDALLRKGLKGCYDFLHNFVLTHKINILRGQAMELIRGKWFDCIRPENMRRNFVIQYWSGMPGKKSWVEIGITSGKQGAKGWRRAATPQLSVRWFRRGDEIKDHGLVFDWRELDLESCLFTVITKHTDCILQDLRERISQSAGSDSITTVGLNTSEGPSGSAVLLLHHPSLRESLRVRIEPVTGQFSITPPSLPAGHTERNINTNAKTDAAKALVSLINSIVQERVHKEAQLLGWKNTPNLVKQDNLAKLFDDQTRHISVFTPSQAWGDKWAVAATFHLSGEKWWAVSLDDKPVEQGGPVGKILAHARRVPLDVYASDDPLSSAALIRVERDAVAEAAFGALVKELKDMKIPHTLERLAGKTGDDEPLSKIERPSLAMFIRFSSMMKFAKGKPWAAELVRLTHHGLVNGSDGVGNVRHDIRLTLAKDVLKNLQEHVTHFEDRELAMNSTGGLALRFLTPFGQPFAAQMQRRLQTVQRLDSYVATLKQCGFECDRVNLFGLEFTYSDSPKLSVLLAINNDAANTMRLKFEPPDSNPHQRIKVLLKQELNNTANKGFAVFCSMLKFTLPVLQTLQLLESMDAAKRTLVVHARSVSWYSLKYSSPLPNCTFQLRGRKKIEGASVAMKWHLEPAPQKDGTPADLAAALRGLCKEKGEHWEGLGTGIVADIHGIGTVLEQVDEIVRCYKSAAGEVSVKPEGDAPVQTSAGQNKTETPQQQRPSTAAKNSKPATIKKEPDVIMLD